MLESIIKLLIPDNGMKLLSFISTIVIAYITAKFAARNTKKNLTTQYFKEKGVNVQEQVLRFWCTLVMNNFDISSSYVKTNNIKNNKISNKSDTDILIEMQENSYIYCSPKTIKAIKDYMQHVYKSKNKILNNEDMSKTEKLSLYKRVIKKINFCRMFILITRIVSRMKHDFTGEKVDELDIIKIKINDLNILTKILLRLTLCYYNLKENFFIIVLLVLGIIILYNYIFLIKSILFI